MDTPLRYKEMEVVSLTSKFQLVKCSSLLFKTDLKQ